LDRLELLDDWLKAQFPGAAYTLAPASADASFRRYFRIGLPERSLIVMDAPPEHEDCRPFIHVAQLFGQAGANVPQVLAQDLQQGFLLLSDLGSTTYLAAMNQDEAVADPLYRSAAAELIKIQLASRPGELPEYDQALLLREMQLFPDWYVSKHLQTELSSSQTESLNAVFDRLLRNNLAQPKVYVHRDYHSRNLMVTDNGPGVLDFQDAVYGPVTYDLVSLFKDAYISWDEERVLDWLIRYWEQARKAALPVAGDFAEFYRDFEWMGAQRHIKVLGIFARLYHRDGKDGYLKDMPLVMTYLRKTCERYSELHPLLKLLDELENRQAAVGYTF
jgi:hypothetical protein